MRPGEDEAVSDHAVGNAAFVLALAIDFGAKS